MQGGQWLHALSRPFLEPKENGDPAASAALQAPGTPAGLGD